MTNDGQELLPPPMGQDTLCLLLLFSKHARVCHNPKTVHKTCRMSHGHVPFGSYVPSATLSTLRDAMHKESRIPTRTAGQTGFRPCSTQCSTNADTVCAQPSERAHTQVVRCQGSWRVHVGSKLRQEPHLLGYLLLRRSLRLITNRIRKEFVLVIKDEIYHFGERFY